MSPQGEPPGDPELASIRARLRELGYLGGVSGWIAPARGRSRGAWWRVVASSSLRVAALGSPALAVPAAIAIALANRPHRLAFGDLAILTLYLTAVLFASVLVLEALADLGLVALARSGFVLIGRVERLAGRVGLFFTVATTIYIAFMLRGGWAAGRGAGSLEEWFLWIAGLLAAVGAGHVLGRLTRVGSLVTILAAGGSAPGRSRDRRSAESAVWAGVGMALLASLAAVILLAPVPAGSTPVIEEGSLTPRPLEGRMVVLAIDGVGWSSVTGWAASPDRLPALSRLQRGAALFPVTSAVTSAPPVTWTSIATGRPPEDHGVLAYSSTRLPGMGVPIQDVEGGLAHSLRLLWPPLHPRREPVGGTSRRVPAFWDLLAAARIETAVVNWWATWPAGTPPAVQLVSDRALVRFLSGEPPDRDAWPPGLEARLVRSFPSDRLRAEGALDQAGLPPRYGPGGKDIVGNAGLIDAYHGLLMTDFLDGGTARVVVGYLPGHDIARSVEGEGGRGIEAMTRLLDRIVGDLMAALKERDLLVLLADPGRWRDGSGEEGPSGCLLVHGARVSRPGPGSRVDPLDILPTLLTLAGVPLALDLPGTPRVDFLPPGDPANAPPAPVATPGRRPERPDAGEDPMSDEILDRLRSLGYIR